MEEHCPEPGLPARGHDVIVAQALSQVSQVTPDTTCSRHLALTHRRGIKGKGPAVS